jgi:ubiquinone/menaquinone biosynthesis C-methylase UbiE
VQSLHLARFGTGATGRRSDIPDDRPDWQSAIRPGLAPYSSAYRSPDVAPRACKALRMAYVADRSSSPGWLLEEVGSAGRENLDPRHVARYDDKEDAGGAAEVALLVERGLNSRSHVVDLGAGTGQFTLAIAHRCARVVAVDISPVMLERLRSKVVASAMSNVEVVHAGFLTYEHRGPPADFVYSRWALHHLPDFWKAMALHRMRTILRHGGVLRLSDVVYSFDPSEAEERIERWCATLPAEAGGDDAWVRADLDEHVRDEHSTFTWLLEAMMERCGFRIDDASYTNDGILAEYIARAI